MASKQTPSQTIGPFFSFALTPAQYAYPMSSAVTTDLVADDADGPRIRIEGRILDGDGVPVTDAVVEIVQADENGSYASAGRNTRFTGFGRCGTGTDAHCRYWFNTLKPGAVAPGEAPHINVIVFMRGLLSHVYTRLYFADETEANSADAVLLSVPKGRRKTLIAEPVDATGATYRFDIHMQGEHETVFFDI